jgi:hypothetical protein
MLDSKGGCGRACTMLCGGSCACCTGKESADALSGDGGPFVCEEVSNELRGMCDDPDTGPRACVKGEGVEAGVTESLLVCGGARTTGGVFDVADAKGRSLGIVVGRR